MFFTVSCKCGYQSEQPRDLKSAQTLADYHEALNQKRAYRHDANAVPVQQ